MTTEMSSHQSIMHIKKVIEQFGFRPKEVEVYMAALSLGDSTISEIAQKAGIPRTTAQAAVECLKKRGLMNYLVIRKRKRWVAENPEKLLINLREKEAALKMVLPELQALRYDTGVKPTVRLYSGMEGINTILDDIIETKHHILSFSSADDRLRLHSDDFKYFVERRYTRHLKIRLLTNRSPEAEKLKKDDAEELRQTKFLPDQYELKNRWFIYKDKVAIISLNKKIPVGMIIEDKDIAETQTQLFEIAWKIGF